MTSILPVVNGEVHIRVAQWPKTIIITLVNPDGTEKLPVIFDAEEVKVAMRPRLVSVKKE